MARVRHLWFAVLFALAAAPALAAPLEAYARLPNIEDVALSADGARLAAMVTNGDARRIVVSRVADGHVEADLPVGSVKARGIAWAGPDHLLITVSASKPVQNAVGSTGERYGVMDLDMRDRTLHPLLDKLRGAVNIVTGPPSVRRIGGRLMLLLPTAALAPGDYITRLSLAKVDLDDHSAELVWTGRNDANRVVTNAQGEVVAQSEFDPKLQRWRLSVQRGGVWRDVKSVETKFDAPVLLGLGRSPYTVVVAERTIGGFAFREISTRDGAWPEPFASTRGDGHAIWTADDRLAGLEELIGDDPHMIFFDAETERVWKALRATFPGQKVIVASPSDVPGRLIALVDSPQEGLAYAYVDVAAKKAIWIGSAYRRLTPDDILPVRAIGFPASDGLQLSGYLTMPSRKAEKALPLVVLVHDGPNARDMPGFDWLSQAIASRGYAVLRVNFRGSAGFGQAFQEAGYGEWGRKMQTDLSDGVRRLVADGLVDPKRVCIVGIGFGGYAALAGAAFDPATYRCAAAVNGISDLRSFLDVKTPNLQDWYKRYLGVSSTTASALVAISPLAHADQIRAPVLLVHANDDYISQPRQSEEMAAALRRHGSPVQLEVLQKEDHWLSHSDTRLKATQFVTEFLEKNNPPN